MPPPQTVAAAEAEGVTFPTVAVTSPEALRYAKEFGPQEQRRCVETGKESRASSGDFVAGPFQGYILRDKTYGRKTWWAPRQRPATPLRLRGTLIGSPDVVVNDTFTQTTRPVARTGPGPEMFVVGPSFFPTWVRFPRGGKWLVVVTSGDNWGCFIMDEPDL